MTVALILALAIAFQVKHFICDFPLQGPYMLGKFKEKGWVGPLAAHAAVHVVGTLTVLVCAGFNVIPLGVMLALALFDGIVHFTVDRIKASPRLLGRFKIEQPAFWWALGADQMAHHLTHYAIIACAARWLV